MEIFEKEFEDFFLSCEDYFDFQDRLEDTLATYKKFGVIEDYTYDYDYEHVFDSPGLDIYVVSIAAITIGGKLFHTLRTFALD